MRFARPHLFGFGLFVLLCLGCAAYGQAAALFTVNKVTVDVTADSAFAAREAAFETAQVKAFERLVKRLAPAESRSWALEGIGPSAIAAMIKDYEIISEKISDVRYVGTYTFRFKSAAVKQYFSGRSLNYSDLESEPVMVLPFYQVKGRYDLWSYSNRWKKAWDRDSARRSLVPIVVPVGDLEDVRDLRNDQAFSYDRTRLFQLVQRYGAKEAVIAVAIPDSGLLQGLQSGDLSQGSLIVTLYRTDSMSPQEAAQFFVTADPASMASYDAMFDEAVRRVKGLLRDNWKAQTMVSAGRMQTVQLRVGLRRLQDWVKVRDALHTVSAVRSVRLDGLTMGRAVVTLTYEGELSRLQLAMGRKKMQLAQLQHTDVRLTRGVPMYGLVYTGGR